MVGGFIINNSRHNGYNLCDIFTKLNRVTTSLSFESKLDFNSLNTGVMVNHQNSMNLFEYELRS
jgi:hypothetical protein